MKKQSAHLVVMNIQNQMVVVIVDVKINKVVKFL
jgi:hypothetical protein